MSTHSSQGGGSGVSPLVAAGQRSGSSVSGGGGGVSRGPSPQVLGGGPAAGGGATAHHTGSSSHGSHGASVHMVRGVRDALDNGTLVADGPTRAAVLLAAASANIGDGVGMAMGGVSSVTSSSSSPASATASGGGGLFGHQHTNINATNNSGNNNNANATNISNNNTYTFKRSNHPQYGAVGGGGGSSMVGRGGSIFGGAAVAPPPQPPLHYSSGGGSSHLTSPNGLAPPSPPPPTSYSSSSSRGYASWGIMVADWLVYGMFRLMSGLTWLRTQWTLWVTIAVVCCAYIAPLLAANELLTTVSVATVFFLNGLSLPLHELLQVRRHMGAFLLMSVHSFIISPMIAVICGYVIPVSATIARGWLLSGLLCVSVLPPPTLLSVMSVGAAGGSETFSMCLSAAGNLVGAVASPLVLQLLIVIVDAMGLVGGSSNSNGNGSTSSSSNSSELFGGHSFAPFLLHIALVVLMPMLTGVAIQYWLAARHNGGVLLAATGSGGSKESSHQYHHQQLHHNGEGIMADGAVASKSFVIVCDGDASANASASSLAVGASSLAVGGVGSGGGLGLGQHRSLNSTVNSNAGGGDFEGCVPGGGAAQANTTATTTSGDDSGPHFGAHYHHRHTSVMDSRASSISAYPSYPSSAFKSGSVSTGHRKHGHHHHHHYGGGGSAATSSSSFLLSVAWRIRIRQVIFGITMLLNYSMFSALFRSDDGAAGGEGASGRHYSSSSYNNGNTNENRLLDNSNNNINQNAALEEALIVSQVKRQLLEIQQQRAEDMEVRADAEEDLVAAAAVDVTGGPSVIIATPPSAAPTPTPIISSIIAPPPPPPLSLSSRIDWIGVWYVTGLLVAMHALLCVSAWCFTSAYFVGNGANSSGSGGTGGDEGSGSVSAYPTSPPPRRAPFPFSLLRGIIASPEERIAILFSCAQKSDILAITFVSITFASSAQTVALTKGVLGADAAGLSQSLREGLVPHHHHHSSSSLGMANNAANVAIMLIPALLYHLIQSIVGSLLAYPLRQWRNQQHCRPGTTLLPSRNRRALNGISIFNNGGGGGAMVDGGGPSSMSMGMARGASIASVGRTSSGLLGSQPHHHQCNHSATHIVLDADGGGGGGDGGGMLFASPIGNVQRHQHTSPSTQHHPNYLASPLPSAPLPPPSSSSSQQQQQHGAAGRSLQY